MLSVSPISSAGGAAGYYAKDDYYVGNPEMGESSLEWGGAGADLLGVAGAASQEQLQAMLEGDLAALVSADALDAPDSDSPAEFGAAAPDVAGEPAPSSLEAAQSHDEPEAKRTEVDSGEQAAVAVTPAQAAAARAAPDADRRHKPGDDLTFSAPKSVSLAILVGGDKELLKAFHQSVEYAMAYAQEHFAMTRVRDGRGRVDYIKTENLTYQKTTHSTSRHGDPQIHQHVVLGNFTFEHSRGAWLALFNRPIYEHQRLLGAIQRQDLAERVMSLGYDLAWKRDGTFELANVPQSAIEQFSKSAARVEKNLEEAGPVTGGAREIAKLKDRPTKLQTGMEKLQERWTLESREIGVDFQAITDGRDPSRPGRDATPVTEGVMGKGPGWFSRAVDILAERLIPLTDLYGYRPGAKVSERDIAARSLISRAIQTNEAQRTVFQSYNLLRDALNAGRGAHRVEDLQRQVDMLIGERRLDHARFDVTIETVTTPTRAKYVQGLTTAKSLATEKYILGVMNGRRGGAAPLFDQATAASLLTSPHTNQEAKPITLNAGQLAAATHVLTSSDRVIGIHGSAGVGKTTLLGATVEVAKVGRAGALAMLGMTFGAIRTKGMEAYGVTKSHSAKNELIAATGMQADSVAKFLLRHQNILSGEEPTQRQLQGWDRRILFVDEASLLGNADFQKILAITSALGVAKTVFVGDVRQLNAPEAGAPFRYLLNQGLRHAKVEAIVRQADPDLRATVAAFTKGQGAKALGELELRGDIVSTTDRAKTVTVVDLAVETWRRAFDGQGIDRPVITVNQVERHAVNTGVAHHLAAVGAITPLGATFERLVPRHLQGTEQWRIENYALGDKLQFHGALDGAGIARGERVTVVGKDASGRQKLLYVERADGSRTRINLSDLGRRRRETFTAYTPKHDNQLYQNGKHTWESSDTKRNLLTGEIFTIVGEERGLYRVRLRDGSEILMSPRDPQFNHSALAYAQTVYRWQGGTTDRPIALLDAGNASQANAYVAISRAVHAVTIVTDDVDKLRDRVRLNTGVNIVASENSHGAVAGSHPGNRGLREFLDTGIKAVLEIAAMAQAAGSDRQAGARQPQADKIPNSWKSALGKSSLDRETDPSLVRAPMDKNMVADRQPAIPERSR